MTRRDAPLFSWLHLSDLHFGHGGARGRSQRALVLDQLLLDVRRGQRWGVPAPDAVFVTGDVAFSGASHSGTEYDEATAWLDRLVASLGLDRSDVYLVPGNHDVVRAADGSADHPLIARVRGGDPIDDALAEPGAQARLTGRLAAYTRFASQFGPGRGDRRHTSLAWRTVITSNGLQVQVIGWNSALLANDATDRQKLQLGAGPLAFAFADLDENSPVIALAHHPLDWLRDHDDVHRWIEQRVDVLLSGHVHRQDARLIRHAGGRRFINVVAGTTHDPGMDFIRYGFNFGVIRRGPRAKLRLQVWPFAFTERREFVPDPSNIPVDKQGRLQRYATFDLDRNAPERPAVAERAWPDTPVPPPAPPVASPTTVEPPARPVIPERYQPPLAIYVVWDLDFEAGAQIAEHLYGRFHRGGDTPLSQGVGIPIFFRTTREGQPAPGEIPLDGAEHTAVVVLVDPAMFRNAATTWARYLTALWAATRGAGRGHRVIPVAYAPSLFGLAAGIDEVNFLRAFEVEPAERDALLDERLTHELCRLLLHAPVEPTRAAHDTVPPVKLFLSHTKVPGDGGVDIARRVRTWVNEHTPVRTFFDALDIPAGESFAEVIERNLGPGSGHPREPVALLAIQTDSYASRAWCQREVLAAKRHGCAIVVVNAVQRREERSFPYLGNTPTYRWPSSETGLDEHLRAIVDLALMEVLRLEYLSQHLRALAGLYPELRARTMARSPELLTLIGDHTTYLYPDPPLAEAELEVLRSLRPGLRLITPLQLAAQRPTGAS